MRRSLIRIAELVLGGMLVLTMLMGPGILAAPATLLFGWWPSSIRLIEAWHPHPNPVVLFALAVIVLVAGSHAFLSWLYLRSRGSHENAFPAKWPWKWTLCSFGVLFCALLAICSLVLTTHQLYWISRSSDPLFTDPFRQRIGMLKTAMTLQNAAQAAQWNRLKTREAFWKENSISASQPPAEVFQPVWIGDDEHRLSAIILIPRRPMHRARAKVTVLQPGTNLVTRSLDELPQVLGSFGIGSEIQTTKGKPTLLP